MENFDFTTLISSSEPWILKISSIFIVALLITIAVSLFLKYASKASAFTTNVWDDALIKAIEAPLVAMVWIIGVKLSYDIIISEFYEKSLIDGALALKIAIIFCMTWFLLRFTNSVSRSVIEAGIFYKKEVDYTTIDAISKLVRLCIIILAILVIMQNLGFSISGILAAGGIGGLVVGFAAKDLLANFLGGFTIYLDRPFVVGDWIRCNEKNIEGIVEHIGWRHTRIRAFNKNPIYVPNGIFTTVVVENPSRMSHRRIDETIILCHCDNKKITLITAQIAAMLDLEPQIDHEQVKLVNFEHFNELGLEISIYAFTKNTDLVKFKKFKQEILLKISEIITQNGARIALSNRALFEKNDQY